MPEPTLTSRFGPLRELRNPEARLEIPAGFPPITPESPENIFKLLEEQLDKRGLSLSTVGRVNLAFPMKHPRLFPKHMNTAQFLTVKIMKELMKEAPGIEWIKADGIVETIHLNRSDNQRIIHTLTAKQKYVFYPDHQMQPLPFMMKGHNEKEHFLIVDTCIDQGTTAANLMSLLLHNGADVLGFVSSYSQNGFIAQQKARDVPDCNLRAPFNAAGSNNARIPELAHEFAKSANGHRLGWTPEYCIDTFEQALKSVGHSLLALTDGECQRLVDGVNNRRHDCPLSFPGILQGVQQHGESMARLNLYRNHFAPRS